MPTDAPAGYPLVRAARLPGGLITATVEQAELDPDLLFEFAARDNPKRAFLFLSKVLGKHLPVNPERMQDVHERLARLIPVLPQPVAFIGMAETATGLGHGVFEAWLARDEGASGVFIHTSRYRVSGAGIVAFEESHSHAPAVYLHVPLEEPARSRFMGARSLVLIDDEISTGNTFVNLAKACRQLVPSIERVHLGCITDFMGVERRANLAPRFGMPTGVGSLLRGSYVFEASAGGAVSTTAAQRLEGNEGCICDNGLGRLGRTDRITVPKYVLNKLHAACVTGKPTLVLGTGEFMHLAFLLGRELKKLGGEVFLQSTTRSPIREWGAITGPRTFPDNYGEGVCNYVYALDPKKYGLIVICCETDHGGHMKELAKALGARLVVFTSETLVEESPFC